MEELDKCHILFYQMIYTDVVDKIFWKNGNSHFAVFAVWPKTNGLPVTFNNRLI